MTTKADPRVSCSSLLQMFYVNPLTWTFRAAVLNEFQSPEYDVCATSVAEGEVCPKSLGQVSWHTCVVNLVVALVVGS